MMANAFIPIRPIPESSSGYQNFLNFLANAGAVTNLADSIMYRWKDNPEIRIGYPEEVSFPVQSRAGKLDTDINGVTKPSAKLSDLKKAEPYINNIRITNNSLNGQDGQYSMHKTKPAGLARIRAPFSVKGQQDTINHEVLGHGVSTTRPEFQERNMRVAEGKGRYPDFYDNYTKRIIPFDEYNSYKNYYERSTPEIMAESNRVNDKTFGTRLEYNGVTTPAARPEVQVHPIYRNFMQNISKLGKAMPAISIPSQILQLKDLYDGINKNGVSSAYAKWLGLEEGKDYVAEGKSNPRMY